LLSMRFWYCIACGVICCGLLCLGRRRHKRRHAAGWCGIIAVQKGNSPKSCLFTQLFWRCSRGCEVVHCALHKLCIWCLIHASEALLTAVASGLKRYLTQFHFTLRCC
jgi:hypothetical protein